MVTIGLSRTVSEINGDVRRKSPIFPPPVYLTPPMKGFPLEFGIGAGVSRNYSDGAFRWSKKFSDRFSRFDTIPECDSQPATQPASQPATLPEPLSITLNAKASSLKTPHFRTYSRRALNDIPQTLHGDRARRAHHNRWDPFFDPTYSFSYGVHGKIWPNLQTRGFSAITSQPVM